MPSLWSHSKHPWKWEVSAELKVDCVNGSILLSIFNLQALEKGLLL